MLNGKAPINFKKAVISVENAYYDGRLPVEMMEREIKRLAALALGYKQANAIAYEGRDRERFATYGSVFKVMSDTVKVVFAPGDTLNHLPFTYDFEDIAGRHDWSKMFVSKLLRTGTGNCHSLPYLYKMVVEELGENTHLALAPKHVYIKHRSDMLGMYNTELTSGTFPIDAWLMASGYIHLEAIQNGLYMEALSDKQSIALCLVDLAQGYEHKYGMDDVRFILLCVEAALAHYPNYPNALLLQSEALKAVLDQLAQQRQAAQTQAEKDSLQARHQKVLDHYTGLIKHIHTLGYRHMPEEMYLQWLASIKEQRKYQNPQLNTLKTY